MNLYWQAYARTWLPLQGCTCRDTFVRIGSPASIVTIVQVVWSPKADTLHGDQPSSVYLLR